MKKILYCILFVFAMLSAQTVNAQTNYIKVTYGCEYLTSYDFDTSNHVASVSFIHYANEYLGIEAEYSHGFKNDGIKYNRFGGNLICELTDNKSVAPYIKLGVAYKNYDLGEYCNIGGTDFKAGFGINAHVNDRFCIVFAFDFTNIVTDEHGFDWDNTLFYPNVGLAIRL